MGLIIINCGHVFAVADLVFGKAEWRKWSYTLWLFQLFPLWALFTFCGFCLFFQPDLIRAALKRQIVPLLHSPCHQLAMGLTLSPTDFKQVPLKP